MTTGSLSREAGGLFESVRSLGKALQVEGLEVAAYGLWDKHWEADAPSWHPLTAKACRYFGPRAVACSPQMNSSLEFYQPDLVHLNGLWQYSSVATHRLRKRSGTPYLISPRGMLDPWALQNSGWKKKLAGFWVENSVLRNAASLHALCDSEADSINAYGLRQRINVVPNGVKLPDQSFQFSDFSFQRGERKRLLFLGRIHPKKGLIDALRGWARIQNPKSQFQNSKQWQFVIAGWDQGGHEAELKTLCSELGLKTATQLPHGGTGNMEGESLKLDSYKLKTLPPESENADVVFYGPAFGGEKEALLRSAEAFILPSFSEGLPMSVLEAWSYGLPVVMTPECNLPEGFVVQAALEIRNGDFGNSNWDGVREILEMSDRDRVEMGRQGRRLVEEKFTWSKVAAQMKTLYEEILAK